MARRVDSLDLATHLMTPADFYDFRPPAATRAGTAPLDAAPQTDEVCDVCGSGALEWRKCKLVCLQCRSIVKSCADL